MTASKDFSKKVLNGLSKKGISIVGATAVPGFEGDKYFTGTAYQLVWNGVSFMRDYRQIEVISASSWCPKEYFSAQGLG